jgi:hypothetical protein
MKVRNLVVAGSIVAALGVGAAGTAVAEAATSPLLQTVSQTENIVSAKCYKTHKVTITYYEHSSTKGWVKYPSPKKTVTDSEHCDK